MKVNGPKQLLDEFVKDCLPDSRLDFDKIIPMPAVLEGTSMGSDAEIGIEALTRKPLEIAIPQGRSVLDREPMKEAGIKDYDNLEVWVRRERPQVLETGRKCLQAFQETGYWFASDWRIANWGASWVEQYELIDRTETTIEATFATPWSPPHKILHQDGAPSSASRDQGRGPRGGTSSPYRFAAGGGVVREENPDLTTAFVEEVLGAAHEVDDFYLRPAKLSRRRTTHCRHWRDERQLKRALAAYPAYEPPHAGIEMLMSERQARENFEYFMSGREARIGHLRDFLAPFGVSLAFSERAKIALDAWITRYGAFLYVDELDHPP